MSTKWRLCFSPGSGLQWRTKRLSMACVAHTIMQIDACEYMHTCGALGQPGGWPACRDSWCGRTMHYLTKHGLTTQLTGALVGGPGIACEIHKKKNKKCSCNSVEFIHKMAPCLIKDRQHRSEAFFSN